MEAKMCRVRWCLMAIVLLFIVRQTFSQPFEHNTSTQATSNRPRIFSPRMDYDEWTPLGRGDPLKNDPTFDYVPPVLDRVQYWLDSQSSTEASSKRDILVLGVTAKKTSPKIPDHFLKFVDGPKFMRHHHHHQHEQQQQQQDDPENYRKDFTGSGGAEPPKIIRVTNFRNGGSSNPLDFRNQNRIQSIPASYYPSPYYNDNSKPYTIMMPPPIQQSDIRQQQHQYGMQTEEPPTSILLNLNDNRDGNPVAPRPFHSQSISDTNELSTSSSSSSITFDKSNLVYQSSQSFDRWAAPTNNNNSPESVIWNTNDDIKSYDHYEGDHNAAASANHEVVVGQNANIIVDGDSVNNEQVVIGRKEIIPLLNNKSNDNENSNQNEVTKMHIVIANTSSTLSNDSENDGASKQATVAVVMPSNYIIPKNHTKNSDKHTTIESTTPISTSSTNVSPSRQYSTDTISSSRAVPRLPAPTPMQNSGHRPIQKHQIIPNLSTTTMTMQSGNFINTIIPSKVPSPSAMSHQYITTSGMNQRHPNVKEEMVRPMSSPGKMMGEQSPLAMILNAQEKEKMTTISLNSKTTLAPSTSMTTLKAPIITSSTIKSTTDSIFSHYKQPPKSMHAPMYLIIQGHSKVKTYKPTVNKYGVPVEKNVIDVENTTKRLISKFEQFVNDNTRVASTTRRSVAENNHEVKAKEKRVEQDSLLSLVESGLSAFTPPPPPPPSLSSSPSLLSSSHFE